MKRIFLTLTLLFLTNSSFAQMPVCVEPNEAKSVLLKTLPNGNFITMSKSDFVDYLGILKILGEGNPKFQADVEKLQEIDIKSGLFYISNNKQKVIIVPISICMSDIFMIDYSLHKRVLDQMGLSI